MPAAARSRTRLSVGRREALAAIAALGGASLVPQSAAFPKLCLFNLATGLPCPFCGLTRSVQAAGHGDFTGAMRAHYLGVPFYFLAWAIAAWASARGRALIPLTPARVSLAVGLFLGAWAVRLARMQALPSLAP